MSAVESMSSTCSWTSNPYAGCGGGGGFVASWIITRWCSYLFPVPAHQTQENGTEQSCVGTTKTQIL